MNPSILAYSFNEVTSPATRILPGQAHYCLIAPSMPITLSSIDGAIKVSLYFLRFTSIPVRLNSIAMLLKLTMAIHWSIVANSILKIPFGLGKLVSIDGAT